MSPYTIVLRKIDSCSCKKAAKKSAKTVGKDSWKRQLEKTVGKDRAVVKAGAYILSIDEKTTVYKLEACEIVFFENTCFSCP